MGTFLRAAASILLGLVVFAGLLALLVGLNFTQRLDDSELYAGAFSETGAYARIYDEVLVDEALEERTGGLLGNMEIAAHDEVVDVLREVMPPEYLREQVEANIDRFTAYLRYDVDQLEIYVILEEPLERMETAMLGRVHGYVDGLDIAEPETSDCSPEALQRLAEASANPFAELSQGKLPKSAPSLSILSQGCREREFDRWFGYVLDDPGMGEQAADILGSEVEDLRRSFVEGDTRGFIKAAAGPLVEPVVENAAADVRRQLPPDGRIDLLGWLTSQPGGPGREDIEQQAGSLREALSAVNGPMKRAALVMVVLGILLMALVHLPNPSAMLRWPGITLLVGGGICLVAGLVLNSVAPGMARSAVASVVPSSAVVPAPAVSLAGDLAESLTQQATGGFLPMAAVVVALGAVLIVASLYYNRLPELVGRSEAGSGEGGRNSQT